MFRSLGLFASALCPDPSCHRPKCMFNHGESSRKRKETVEEKEPVTGHETVKSLGINGGRATSTSSQAQPKPGSSKAVPTNAANSLGHHAPVLASKKPRVEADETKGKGTPAAAPEVIVNPMRPPSIPTINLKLSPQPYADRQKGLQTLFQQYTKLYRPLLTEHPDLAHTSALRQEAETSSTCPNIKTYKSAIHHAAVSVSRRAAPDSPTHPSVGTLKESRAAYEKLEKDLAGRLTKEKVAQYLLPLDQFKIWAYPDPRNQDLLNGGDEPDCQGIHQTCSRCKKPFVVSSKYLQSRSGECQFHYGKIQPERIEGKRKWIYTCCRRERGEAGCEEGIHVFTDGDDDAKLAKRKAFKTVQQVWEERGQAGTEAKSKKVADVVGMDCEMIYTTGGSSLARVTVVDQSGVILLDEKVRQPVPILDINTRFSGLHPGELDDAVMDLEAVRSAVCVFVGPESVIVGHGLENDLRALRLLHDKIIDTATIFPHDKGPPYRRALRDLVKEKLGYFIQERTADLGHSSAEDAKATLEVLKWKVRDDAA
ncbi:hypothetical protein BD324DRAFT_664472 [Kockovaella imperatae]|uniref:Exonuclease domain-containing protein n=1 Tax=Kockovaella imperatae TaxID=4999 RepID=A0A1Y1U9G3_9TREE|nr:hypothetical protein BD324DRAFT_664472 [Kockovaella imperatae]ORX34146.1 hypothetical protein BD324DRAFT_664472 [Kockovaella imperatae]